MAASRTPPVAYVDALVVELDSIEADYLVVLEASQIANIDPNRSSGGGMFFLGFAEWGWAPSDPPAEAARMALLGRVREFRPRFKLLFPHPTPEVAERHEDALDLLVRWLERPGGDHSVPPSTDQAAGQLREAVAVLRSARELLPADPIAVRLIVDTNTLIDNPDLTIYADQLGARYRVHLLPVVMKELDDLRRSGRTAELREAATKANRRLKGLRDNGDMSIGVKVAGDITAVFEYVEPRGDGLPGWLDLSVPDDRLAAAALLLQSAHPGSSVYVATSDLNLQTKLAALRLPFVEPPG